MSNGCNSKTEHEALGSFALPHLASPYKGEEKADPSLQYPWAVASIPTLLSLLGITEAVQVMLFPDHDQDVAFFDHIVGGGSEIKGIFLL